MPQLHSFSLNSHSLKLISFISSEASLPLSETLTLNPSFHFSPSLTNLPIHIEMKTLRMGREHASFFFFSPFPRATMVLLPTAVFLTRWVCIFFLFFLLNLGSSFRRVIYCYCFAHVLLCGLAVSVFCGVTTLPCVTYSNCATWVMHLKLTSYSWIMCYYLLGMNINMII